MKLSVWAKQQGVTYQAAWKWWKAGKLPVAAEQMPTGTIIIKEQKTVPGSVALYARVSSHDQKKDLDGQLGRLSAYAVSKGWSVSKAVTEVGSGLNGHRPKLMKLLADPGISIIVVEHRDRLMRFGSEYVESSMRAQGRQLVIVDQSELKDDLVQDMREVLTSFCARLYGRRSAANKAKKAIEAMKDGKKR
jgi:predicted site-specific integrase-resolvase